MNSELTHTNFAPRLGESFRISRDGFPTLDLELNEVIDLRHPDRKLPPHVRQDPFQLTFRGPREPILPQGRYELTHESLGSILLFVIPGGPDGEHQLYNITIN